MVQISLKTEFKEVERSLGRLNGEVEKAASRALNDTAKQSHTRAKRKVKDFMKLKRVGDAARLVRINFSTPSTLTATLSASGGRDSRPSVKHLVGSRALTKSRVRWKTGNRTWTATDAFEGKGKLNGHYFKRNQKGTNKISKLLGPSPAAAIDAANKELVTFAGKKAVERFNHHVDRALKRLGIRK